MAGCEREDMRGKLGSGGRGGSGKVTLALRHQYSLTPDDVFLISPFRDCAKQLNRIAKRLGFRMDRTGTVHKTQGKEATVVILVLGGNIKSQGRKHGRRKNPIF